MKQKKMTRTKDLSANEHDQRNRAANIQHKLNNLHHSLEQF